MLAVAVAVLATWAWWMGTAQVAVYEATATARIEVEQSAHPIQSTVAGTVEWIQMPLGREVQVGDVLCKIDASAQQLELNQAKARLAAIGPEIAAVRKELQAEETAAQDENVGTDATVAEAKAKLDEAKAAEKLAEERLARAQKLRLDSLVSEADFEHAKADLAQKHAATEAARIAIGRIGASGRADLSDRKAQKERLSRQIAVLEGEQLTTGALVVRLENEVNRRVIRASVAGRIAEVAAVTPGSVVEEGLRLGAIVPSGGLRVVAEFPPPRALGRIKVGQTARMRLDGFPWATHGMVSTTVAHVASEVRGGTVRVELRVEENGLSLPLQHGLPGSVEVEVEKASPAVLLLRAAGKVVEGRRGASSESSESPAGSSP